MSCGYVTGFAHGKTNAWVATCLPQHLHVVLRLTRTVSPTLPIAVLRPGFALRIDVNGTDWTEIVNMICVDLRTYSDYTALTDWFL
jgi:hypothetical protein